MVEKFIAQKFVNLNHPVKRLSESMQHQYIMALGYFLYKITNDDCTTRFAYETWVSPIRNFVENISWGNSDQLPLSIVLEAQDKNAKKCFQYFVFDCFYLLEKTKAASINKAYKTMKHCIKTPFASKIVDYIYNYFNGKNGGNKLSVSLRKYRQSDLSFKRKKIKRVLVVATMSAGKSTLINALVGEKINRTQAMACTSKARYVYNVPDQEGATILSQDQLFYTTDNSIMQSEDTDALAIGFSSTLANNRICLIDTPGVNYSEDASHGDITRALISQNDYDLLLVVSNALQLGIDDEFNLLRYIFDNCKKRIVFALNQCDRFSEEDDSINEAISTVEKMIMELTNKTFPIIPVSGMSAFIIRQVEKNQESSDRHTRFLFTQTTQLFEDSYYNLISYVVPTALQKQYTKLIDKTGITYLEKKIFT